MPADLREQIDVANSHGEYLKAYDLAQDAAAQHPDDVWFAYAALLALARTGATEEALIRYTASNIETKARLANDAVLETDVLALRARIEKDRAWRAPQAERSAAFRAASQAYETAYRLSRSTFPGVNAATAALLAGDADKALVLARGACRELRCPARYSARSLLLACNAC